MDDLSDRLQAAARACTTAVLRGFRVTPAEQLTRLAAACAEFGVESSDRYGREGGAVELLEEQVAELLGKPAAAFVVTGTMAQQAVLRTWCERQGSMRVALPDLAHPLHHELDGPRLLHGFRFEPLTTGREVPTATHLEAVPGRLGAAMIELPLRDAGCIAPTWEQLVELSAAARERGVPLHADGARIWEVAPNFPDHGLAELAGLFDSVYVSFYKGLGAFAGSALAADADVVAEVRRWRQRMGGTAFQMTPYALSALVGLRDELPHMAECVAWARAFAQAAAALGLRVHPSPPQSTTFELYTDGDVEAINERLLAYLLREKADLCGRWRPAAAPGTAVLEVAVASPALAHDPAEVAAAVAGIAHG